MSIDEQPMNVYWSGQKSSTSNKYKINYKGTVATVSALPATGNKKGDTYNISEDGSDYIWTGTEWDKFGTNVYIGATSTANGIQGLVPPASNSQIYSLLTGGGTWESVENLGLALNITGSVHRTLGERFADIVNVKDFGAKGDGVENDTASIKAAYNRAVAVGGAVVYFPEGKYRVTEYIDIYRQSVANSQICITFRGAGSDHSAIVADFEDAAHSVFYSFPSDTTKRTAPTSFEGLSFKVANNVNLDKAPGFIWVYGHGNSHFSDISMFSSKNTHLMSLSSQNVRCYNVVSWYGGKSYLYKDTTDIIFTTSQTSTDAGIVIASENVFSSSDVGKLLLLIPTADRSASSQVTITAFIDEKQVSVSGPIYTFSTSVRVLFEPARISATANSNIYTANADCFSQNDVGKTIYIRKAKAGIHGDALLRGKIVDVISASSVELDSVADNSVSNEFFGTAAIDFFNPDNSSNIASSDVKFYQLHLEHYRGIGMVNGHCDSYELIGGKIHGSTTETSQDFASAALWLDDADGSYKLTFDIGTATQDCIVYASNLNSCVSMSDVYVRKVAGQKLVGLETMTSNSGCVAIDGLNLFGSFASPEELILDGNTMSRCRFFGVVQATTSSKIHSYIGNDSFIDSNGLLNIKGDTSIDSGDLLLSKSNSCTVSIEQKGSRKWSLQASSSNFFIRDESANVARLGFSSSTGAVYPPSSNQNLGTATNKWKEVFASEGTINISDAREKAVIGLPPEELMRAWGKVRLCLFQKRDAIAEKGASEARLHVGVVAQDVAEAFASEGLDASRYGLFCYDEWDAKTDDAGNVLRHAGDCYGIRYAEALALECAYQRWLGEQRDARIAVLEASYGN